MAAWRDFERAAPELAAAGRALICQFGAGLGLGYYARRADPSRR